MTGNKLNFLDESRASTSSASLQMHGSTPAGKSELARALHSRLAEIIPKCFKSPREIYQRIIPETDAEEVSIIMDKVDKLTPEEQMYIKAQQTPSPREGSCTLL